MEVTEEVGELEDRATKSILSKKELKKEWKK